MKNKKIAILLYYYIVALFFPSPVYAQMPEDWKGRCVSTTDPDVATIQGLECLFVNIVRVLTPIAGLLLFIMLIIGSFKYLTSGGDPKKTQSAQQTFTWAIAGIVIFFGIWFVLQLIKTITGVDVTIFEIPG